MAYFPLFIELAGARALIVGGGSMALAKAERLAGYGPDITVIAPAVRPEIAAVPGVTVVKRAFRAGDIRGDYALVIAATDDNAVNRQAAALCREKGIPVNVVDTQEECSFIFPSLVRRGPLSIGISTGGASPAAAVRIRKELEAALPDSMGDILEWLRALRPDIRAATESEGQRKGLYQTLLAEALERDRPLTAEETERVLAKKLTPR